MKEIIWVNPFKIKSFSAPPNWWWYARLEKRISNKFAKNFIKKIAMGRLFYGGNWDLSATLFNETDWIKNIKSLKLNYKNFRNSECCSIIKSEILKYGFYKYKNNFLRDEKDIDLLFEKYFKEIIESLKLNGFTLQENFSHDIPKVLLAEMVI